MMFTDWFFAKNKPSLTKYPAYLGHTVHQEEYDTVYKWYEEKRDELEQVRQILEPYAHQVGAVRPDDERETAMQLAQYVRDIVKADRAIIQQQAREIEQLTEQLDALRQQQIMLTTTTPTNKRKPRTTGAKP